MSAKFAGMPVFCISLKRCSSTGVSHRLDQGAHAVCQFAQIRARVSRLDTLHRRTQSPRILNRLGQHSKPAAQGHYLGTLRFGPRCQHLQRALLRIGKPRAGLHAEGVVDHHQQQFAVHAAAARRIKGLANASTSSRSSAVRSERAAGSAAAGGAWSFVCPARKTSTN
jgi:hypothetical protein